MSEPAIKKQIKPHWTRIQSKLEKFDLQNKETYMMQKVTSISSAYAVSV